MGAGVAFLAAGTGLIPLPPAVRPRFPWLEPLQLQFSLPGLLCEVVCTTGRRCRFHRTQGE